MKFLLLIIVGLIPISTWGQKWSPIGAEWYYDVTYAFDRSVDYHRVYCDSIVKIKNIDCRRINIDFSACNNHFFGKIYTYDKNDSIYFYNTDIDSFQILYNFNVAKGESWNIYTKDADKIQDTVIVKVDSIDSIKINGQLLKRLYVTYNYINFRYNKHKEYSTIIQVLGDTKLLVNITDQRIDICDMNFLGSLRCYQDTLLGFYSTGLRDSCTYKYDWLSINSTVQNIEINVYPNPVQDILKIKSANFSKIYYQLIDTRGMILKIGKDDKIDFSKYKSGIYFLRLTIDNKINRVLKVIKNTCPNTAYTP